MTQINDTVIREMVQQVFEKVQSGWGERVSPTVGRGANQPISPPGTSAGPGQTWGQFTDVNQAVAAAKRAQQQLAGRSLAQRQQAVDLIKDICLSQADELGQMEYDETGLGHPPHKPEKVRLVAEISQGVAALQTRCFSGDHGITLDEAGPWGVIGVITPVTHSLPTLANNACDMIAAGNSLVVNPHPGGKKVAAEGAKRFNKAIYEKLGIDNLICVITEPTLETAAAIFGHADIRLLSITGGPGVVAAALKSGKRAICAGPGNPPVVVDETADLANAARCIIDGGAYDNNLLCISEKEVFVLAPVYDAFMAEMEKAGAFRLTAQQMQALEAKAIGPVGKEGYPHANREFVGAEPKVLGQAIGVDVPASCRMLFGPAELNSPMVQAEQMMPVMPIVKADSFEQAVEMAIDAEHGFGHTAIIHSKLVDRITYMGKRVNTTAYVKNGPSVAGDGLGGEGFSSFSIACTTGEGIAGPMTFTRLRRCTMVDNLRIV